MRAGQFYQTHTEHSIPLILITKQQYLSDSNLFTPVEKNGLALQQFVGDVGNIGFIWDEQGQASHIYIGTGDRGATALALATVATRLPAGSYVVSAELSNEALLAWSLAQYQFDRYISGAFVPRVLVISEKELTAILVDADAIFMVRDLINTPTNDLGPAEMADVVMKLAAEYGAEFKQWVGDELVQDNFPAIHAVGRASASAPRLLSLTFGDEKHPKVTLVGKGVCFDSGGLCLKPAAGMRLMKKDMGGAAHVIGLAQWLMRHRLPIHLQVFIPAVENAVSGASYRPGDILRMRNGVSVEIHDTDAEGRLVLADALVKAYEGKPELVVDFATLTGAARVAVGTEIAAMFVNDETLAQELTDAAAQTQDPIWRLPLFDGYEGMFNSTVADLSNASASPYAGAITAALFLQRFITPGSLWVHFDIMAWNVCSKPGKPEGGEAMGIRAVGQFLLNRYGKQAMR